MTAVLIVCAAGASSTFLAHRLRAAARDLSLDLDFSVAALEELPHKLDVLVPSIVLVGSHLGPQLDSIAELAERTGAVTRMLPGVGIDSESVSEILTLVAGTVSGSTDLTGSEGASRA